MNVNLLPCCKPRLWEQESWGTAHNSVDKIQKVLEDSEMGEQEPEAMESRLKTRSEDWRGMKTELSYCVKT